MRLLPREMSFFDRFELQGQKVVEGCRALHEMVCAPDDLVASARQVNRIEQECDDLTHSVVAALHTTFITPIDRNDIHRLVSRLDDIIDLADAAAERLSAYALPVMTEEVKQLSACLVKAAECVVHALRAIRNVRQPEVILAACVEINRLENVTDKLLRAALVTLFANEKDPFTIIKWKEIYETLESATDRCEDVADIIEGVVLEQSA